MSDDESEPAIELNVQSILRSASLKYNDKTDTGEMEAHHSIQSIPFVRNSLKSVNVNTSTKRLDPAKPAQTINDIVDAYENRLHSDKVTLSGVTLEDVQDMSLQQFASNFKLKQKEGKLPSIEPVYDVDFINFKPKVRKGSEAHPSPFYCTQVLKRYRPYTGRFSIPEEEVLDQFNSFIQENGEYDKFTVTKDHLQEIRLEKEAEKIAEEKGLEQCEDEDWMIVNQNILEGADIEDDFNDWDEKTIKNLVSSDEIERTPDEEIERAKAFIMEFDAESMDVEMVDEKVAFNREQKAAIKLFSQSGSQILALLVGGPGTGKSTVIRQLKRKLGEKVKVTATTGTAAFLIGGTTAHSAMKLPVNTTFKEWKSKDKKHLQTEWKDATHLIVDEFSMMSHSMLSNIDKALQCITGNPSIFGGVSVLLSGDLNQLPPVLAEPMYSDKDATFYREFKKVVMLQEVCRQGRGQEKLKALLANCANGEFTKKDFNLLKTRFSTSVGDEEAGRFNGSTILCYKNKDVAARNIAKLNSLNNPVFKIVAENSSKAAAKAQTKDTWSLENVLYVCIGATVMLRWNVCVERGLHNGTTGTVHSLLYSSTNTSTMPEFIVLQIPSYTGTPFIDGVPGTVPIEPGTARWHSRNGSYCTRTMFPIVLSWCMTVHKAQGKSLDQVVVDLGDIEPTLGFTLVALSRVRTLNGLLLVPFNYDRLLKVNNNKARKQLAKELKRLQRTSNATIKRLEQMEDSETDSDDDSDESKCDSDTALESDIAYEELKADADADGGYIDLTVDDGEEDLVEDDEDDEYRRQIRHDEALEFGTLLVAYRNLGNEEFPLQDFREYCRANWKVYIPVVRFRELVNNLSIIRYDPNTRIVKYI